MRLERIASLAERGLSFDWETHLAQIGLQVPPAVVGSAAWLERGPTIAGTILEKHSALETLSRALEDPNAIIVGANLAFDLMVFANELAKMGVDAMPQIFRAFSEDRIYDVQIAEMLHAIATGHLGKDPRTGGQLKNPETGKIGRYSLSICVDLVLGRQDAKANDKWRLRYAELEHIPISQWPAAARDYPVDDARNTLEVALAQTGHLPKTGTLHSWVRNEHGPVCLDCGATRLSAPCIARKKHFNLHDLSNQTWTAFCMAAGAAWGFKIDQSAVDIIERHALRTRERGRAPFQQAGLIRTDGSEDRAVIKRAVAVAYGSKEPCPNCRGTGKIPSPAAKPVRCSTCRGRCKPWKAGKTLKEPTVAFCEACQNTGQIPNPNPPLINCVAPDGSKTCDGTGLRLAEEVPRSDKDGVGYGTDVLFESGDENLMSFGAYKEDAKTLDVYVPYLRNARVEDPINGQWWDVPLTLRPNVLVETGRTSYDGVIQLLPREPGYVDHETGEYVPSIRECFVARDGYVFSSEDFKAGEIVTHAQSCKWLVGFSDLGEALLKGIDPHGALAATVLGMNYAEFDANKKQRRLKDTRQAAKPISFGKPAGMGDIKIVQTQRRQGPDTPSPQGPSMIKDLETGKMVRGYKGLRFCILMDGVEVCGERKITSWRGERISPTCSHCVECVARISNVWKRQWREADPYFKLVQDILDNGMLVTAEALERWPWLKETFKAGTRLDPGTVMQHVSGRLRAGTTFTSCANGFFQAMLADCAKLALRLVTRECYDSTYRVPVQLFHNSKVSKYTGGPSPLFGSRVIGFFHDELFIEHREATAHDGATRASEIMRDCLRWYCPDYADAAEAEPTLMRRWYKNAEKVVKDGRLVPWQPN